MMDTKTEMLNISKNDEQPENGNYTRYYQNNVIIKEIRNLNANLNVAIGLMVEMLNIWKG